VASLQTDPRTGHLAACLNVRRDGNLKRFYLSLGTEDRSLGTGKRTFAQDLISDVEDAAHGAIPHSDVVARIHKIPDLRVRERGEKILAKVLHAGLGISTVSGSVEDTINKWVARQSRVIRKSSAQSYENTVKRFLSFLGEHAKLPLHRITREDMEGFQETEIKLTSASTAFLKIKILRIFFKDAIIRGFLTANPTLGVKKTTEDSKRAGRRPFNVEQLKAIEKQCKDAGEWRGIFLFGLYTGQRLADIANLRWHNLNMEGAEAKWTVCFTTRKTDRQMDIPIASPLRDYILEELDSSDDEDAFVFPKSALKTAKGRSGTLSNEFRKILKSAGIVKTLADKNPKNPKGRAAKREESVYSFHSLRHSAVSLMKNAGISPEIVRDIIGHDSPAVSSIYTHISHEAKSTALSSMPALGEPPKPAKGPTGAKKPTTGKVPTTKKVKK
jgi:integrase